MCGLTGFFTGCDFVKQCDDAGHKCPHRIGSSLFANWHERASVRRAPRRILDPDDLALDLFPRALVPVASHEIIKRKYTEKIPHLLALALFRYLSFTINLEMLVVNPATQQLLLDKLPFRLSGEDVMDAYKIYCDEAYHALFCADMLSQVIERAGFSPSEQKAPYFLRRYEEMEGASDEVALNRFLFATASEMMITSSLSHVRENQQRDNPAAIRQIMTDHSADEARHHVFYRDVFSDYSRSLSRDVVVRMTAKIPNYILAFITPDLDNIISDLVHIGLTIDEARQVCEEIYSEKVIEDYANDCSGGIKNMLVELGLSEEPEISDNFNRVGILI